MDTNKTKVVKYDPQGFIRTAAQAAPWLLTVNDEMVQKFFTAMAVEQPDGSLLLPESIRSFFAVEVVYEDAKPIPPFEVDIFAAIPSIYDAPKPDSPVSESIDSYDTSPTAFERALATLPELDSAKGSDSGEFELAAIDRIIVDQLPVNNR
jgi:hypothetical protein